MFCASKDVCLQSSCNMSTQLTWAHYFKGLTNNTRPRRPGFKGHLIEFLIILDPYLGPLFGTPMDSFEPIWTYQDLRDEVTSTAVPGGNKAL